MIEFTNQKTKYNVLNQKIMILLLLVKLLTGRKHQIRKHFFEIGHPILGDKKYNITNTNHSAINNFFLHSYSIKFEDIDGNQKNFY